MAGNDLRKVVSGDPMAISATTFNALVEGSRESRARWPELGGQALRASRERTVVVVTNSTPDEEAEEEGIDWPMWTPVAVCMPEDQPIETALAFAAQPFFPGYRLDDLRVEGFFMLGITQEPIARGQTGRVCIRGLTFALMQKCPDDMTGGGNRDWVHVFKIPADEEDEESEDRWTLREGPGGDARILGRVSEDPYEDGVYDDQQLVLIDLCDVPNRVRIKNGAGTTVPAHSIVYRADSAIDYVVNKLPASTSSYSAWTTSRKLLATCGWDLEADGWGWGYGFSPDVPVKVVCGRDIQAETTSMGPANGSFEAWPFLPGFRIVGPDWFKSGEPARVWVIEKFASFWAKAGSHYSPTGTCYAWACSQLGEIIYNGTEQNGITYPLVRANVSFYNIYVSGGTSPRCPNVRTGQIFRVSIDLNITPHQFHGDSAVMDDPIGTVKLWVSGEAIPPGWREYPLLAGRFPVGLSVGDPDFGWMGNYADVRTHAHGSAAVDSGVNYAALGTPAKHLPPYAVVKFIERYG